MAPCMYIACLSCTSILCSSLSVLLSLYTIGFKYKIRIYDNYQLKITSSIERKLNNSRTSMPALACPCTFSAETRKHAGARILQHIGHVYHCRCVNDQHLSHTEPEPSGCLGCWEKAGPSYLMMVPRTPILEYMGHIYHCGCADDQYLSPYWTRTKWLSWLLRKSGAFILKYRPLEQTSFNIWGIFTIVYVWMINTYYYTKQEPCDFLGCYEKAGSLYLDMGPWGPHPLTYDASLPLWMCGWSIPITILIQSQIAAFVAKKKCALYIYIRAPGWLLRKNKPLKFVCWAPGPLTLDYWGQNDKTFHPCNMFYKCAKLGPSGYCGSCATLEQRNLN